MTITMRQLIHKHVPNAPLTAPKRSKYGNKRGVMLDGMKFDSQAEARRYAELLLLQKAGEIAGLKRQQVFECMVNGKLVCKYVADFVYLDSNGQRTVEDLKGFETALFRLKAKLVDACFGFKIKLVKVKR